MSYFHFATIFFQLALHQFVLTVLPVQVILIGFIYTNISVGTRQCSDQRPWPRLEDPTCQEAEAVFGAAGDSEEVVSRMCPVVMFMFNLFCLFIMVLFH